MEKHSATERTAVELADACEACAERGDWAALHGLLHSDVRIRLRLTREAVVYRDNAIDALTENARSFKFSRRASPARGLAPRAAISLGNVQFTSPDGTMGSDVRAWLFVERKGLVYRWVACADTASAEALYRDNGPDLGIA